MLPLKCTELCLEGNDLTGVKTSLDFSLNLKEQGFGNSRTTEF